MLTTETPPTSSNRSCPQCHFLSLPFELRTAIYEYVLDVSSTERLEVHITSNQLASSDAGRLVLQYSRRPRFHPDLAIFRASRKTYNEVLPILYKHCLFYPLADENVISLFFGQMSEFALSNILKLHLKPRSDKIVRLVGPRGTISQLLRGPSWGPACDKVSKLLLALEELYVHLHSMYGYQLEKGDCIGWIIRPLSRLQRVQKTLISVGDRAADDPLLALVTKWNKLIQKADREAAEYVACRNRIMESDQGWPDAYWMLKRHKLL